MTHGTDWPITKWRRQ